MKKHLILLFFILGITNLILSACAAGDKVPSPMYAPNQEVYAFANVHNYGDYLGFARLRTDSEGYISDIYLDEVFMPAHWAEVDLLDAKPLNIAIIKRMQRGNEIEQHFAKYIMVGRTPYVFLPVPDPEYDGFFTPSYQEANPDGTAKSGGIANINEHVYSSDANGKAYFDAVANGNAFVMKLERSTLVRDTKVFTATPGNIVKANSIYWTSYPTAKKNLGFSNNMRYLQNDLMKFGFNFDVDTDTARDDKTGEITILDSVSHATSADYKNYLKLAQAAEKKLKKK